MIEAARMAGIFRCNEDFDSTEDPSLRAAWSAAWLHEHRAHVRYRSLLATDAAEEIELRFAWLAWWDAACVCREALRRLEDSQS